MDQLTGVELGYFQELFDLINKDGDGSITFKEIELAIEALGGKPTESQVQEMVNEADTDGNGTLEMEEFVNVLLGKMNSVDNQEELREAFYVFDKDRNGFISSAELKTVYIGLGLKISDEEIDEMIREADIDQDGVITLDEFLSMMSYE
ncbi:hypothetical protein ACLKA7_013362 [Drosophila subpalustris]